MPDLTLTLPEFAKTLGVEPKTIHNRMSTKPHSLPKPLRIPEQKTLVWLREDVEKWLRGHRPAD